MSDVTSLLTTSDIVVPAVKDICRKDLTDDVPNIQFSSLSVDFEITAINNPVSYVDRTAFHNHFDSEINQMSKIERLVEQGKTYVHMLYAMRSVTQAIPMVNDMHLFIFV